MSAARDTKAEAARDTEAAEDIKPDEEIRNAGNKMTGIGVCMVISTIFVGSLYFLNRLDLEGCQGGGIVNLYDGQLYVGLAHFALAAVVALGVLSMRFTYNALSGETDQLDQSTPLNESPTSNGYNPDTPGAKKMATQAMITRWSLLFQVIIKVVIFVLLVDCFWEVWRNFNDDRRDERRCMVESLIAFFPLAFLTFVLSVVSTFVYMCIDV